MPCGGSVDDVRNNVTDTPLFHSIWGTVNLQYIYTRSYVVAF